MFSRRSPWELSGKCHVTVFIGALFVVAALFLPGVVWGSDGDSGGDASDRPKGESSDSEKAAREKTSGGVEQAVEESSEGEPKKPKGAVEDGPQQLEEASRDGDDESPARPVRRRVQVRRPVPRQVRRVDVRRGRAPVDQVVQLQVATTTDKPAATEPPPVLRIDEHQAARVEVPEALLKTPGVKPHERITIDIAPRHMDAQDAVSALTMQAGTLQREGEREIHIFQVPGSRRILVTAAAADCEYLYRILLSIDRPEDRPERIVRFFDIEWNDVSQVANILDTFVRQPTMRGPARVVAPSGARSTKIIQDPVNNKIIVETHDEGVLEDIEMLVREIDARREPARPQAVSRVIQLEHQETGDVVALLVEFFEVSSSSRTRRRVTRTTTRRRTSLPSSEVELQVVANEETGSILLHGLPAQVEAAARLVRLLDRPRFVRPKSEESSASVSPAPTSPPSRVLQRRERVEQETAAGAPSSAAAGGGAPPASESVPDEPPSSKP